MLAKGAVVGHASSVQVTGVGATLLQTCVIERGVGGMGFNIGKPRKVTMQCETRFVHLLMSSLIDLEYVGGDNKVEVVLASYKPNIKCDTSSAPKPPWDSCTGLFSNMRADETYRIFGPNDQENIQVGLPLILETGMLGGQADFVGSVISEPLC